MATEFKPISITSPPMHIAAFILNLREVIQLMMKGGLDGALALIIALSFRILNSGEITCACVLMGRPNERTSGTNATLSFTRHLRDVRSHIISNRKSSSMLSSAGCYRSHIMPWTLNATALKSASIEYVLVREFCGQKI